MAKRTQTNQQVNTIPHSAAENAPQSPVQINLDGQKVGETMEAAMAGQKGPVVKNGITGERGCCPTGPEGEQGAPGIPAHHVHSVPNHTFPLFVPSDSSGNAYSPEAQSFSAPASINGGTESGSIGENPAPGVFVTNDELKALTYAMKLHENVEAANAAFKRCQDSAFRAHIMGVFESSSVQKGFDVLKSLIEKIQP